MTLPPGMDVAFKKSGCKKDCGMFLVVRKVSLSSGCGFLTRNFTDHSNLL